MKKHLWKKAARCSAVLAGMAAAGIYLYFLPPVKRARKKTYPYALLLGCPAHADGSLSRSQKARCQLAIDAWKQGLYSTLVISGGAVKNHWVESEVMKDYIHRFAPIPIICEDQARNTFENFQKAAAIIQNQPVLILTSSLHARRSSAIARQFFTDFGLMTYPDHKPKHILREIPSRAIYIRLEIQKRLKKPKA